MSSKNVERMLSGLAFDVLQSHVLGHEPDVEFPQDQAMARIWARKQGS